MKVFVDEGLSKEELNQLNKCRLFLRAFQLSDIADGSGLCITDDAWQGRANDMFHKLTWRLQGNPTRNAWDIWRRMLKKCFLGRGLRLKNPLGMWNSFDTTWPWYYAPSTNNLYLLSDNKYVSFPCINNRNPNPVFSTKGQVDCLPKIILRATVYKKGDKLICTGKGGILLSPPSKAETF
jgi:hypothetical protein